MTSKKILLGAHMSIAGGIENAYVRAASIQCTAVQYFTHSNRQWKVKDLAAETVTAVKKARSETEITHDMVHASYLINVASSSSETCKKSYTMLGMELEHCAELGIKHLVLHPGSRSETQEGLSMISTAINELFELHSLPTMILLEITAGQGTQLGHTFEQLATIKEGITDKRRIGFCIDTCHLWAVGYDFSTEKGYESVWQEFDSIIGLSHIKAIHLNDSKQKLGSHVDRHADIGKGTIGLEAFRLIMNDDRFATVPKILETPGKELEEYAENMRILKGLLT
jgi:deoxyribonuclease-4